MVEVKYIFISRLTNLGKEGLLFPNRPAYD
jgi:hypothetical protein